MLLDVKGVDKKFNGVYALKGLDFSLGEGEVHGLIGENGAGKSTFIKILGGVYKRDGGNILWNGKDLPEAIRPEDVEFADFFTTVLCKRAGILGSTSSFRTTS